MPTTTLRSLVNYFVGTGKDDIVHFTNEDTYDKDVFDEHVRVLASFGLPVWEESDEAEVVAKEPVAEEATPEVEETPAPVPEEPASSIDSAPPSMIEDDSGLSRPRTMSAVTRALTQVEEKHTQELDALRTDYERRLHLQEKMTAIVRSDNELEVKGLKEERAAAIQALEARLAQALQDVDIEHHSHSDEAAISLKREQHLTHLLEETKLEAQKQDETHTKELRKRQNKIDQLEHLVESLTAELHKALQDLLELRKKHQEATDDVVRQMEEHRNALAAGEAKHAQAMKAKNAELKKHDEKHSHRVERMKITHAHLLEELKAEHAAEMAKLKEQNAAVVIAIQESYTKEVQSTRAALLKAHREEADALKETMATIERVHREAIEHQQEAFTSLAAEHAIEVAWLENANAEQVTALLERLEELRQVHRACEPRRLELEVNIEGLKERLVSVANQLEAARQEEVNALKEQIHHLQEALVASESQHALNLSELRDAQAQELEASVHALETVSEENKSQASDLAAFRDELQASAERIAQLQAELEKATEDNSRLISEAEETRAELRTVKAAAAAARPLTPVTPVKNTVSFPFHPTPPESPKTERRSFVADSPSPSPAPASTSGHSHSHSHAHFHSRSLSTASRRSTGTSNAQPHECRLEHLSQKYHIPALMHLPHSMHRCSVHGSPLAEEKDATERIRKPTLLSKRSITKSLRLPVRESSGSQVSGTFGGN